VKEKEEGDEESEERVWPLRRQYERRLMGIRVWGLRIW
jgi:hypothetical protein